VVLIRIHAVRGAMDDKKLGLIRICAIRGAIKGKYSRRQNSSKFRVALPYSLKMKSFKDPFCQKKKKRNFVSRSNILQGSIQLLNHDQHVHTAVTVY
jgi:hypothetical protein